MSRFAKKNAGVATNRQGRFFGVLAALCLATVAGHVAAISWLDAEFNNGAARLAENAQLERIVKQEWWIEENKELGDEIGRITGRFWTGETLGIVRAELEKSIQNMLADHGLQITNILIDTRVTNSNGLSLVASQLKFQGPTSGTIKALSELSSGQREVFLNRVNLRFFPTQVIADLAFDVPIVVKTK